MVTAVNPQTGERVQLNEQTGQWTPIAERRAIAPQDGAVIDGRVDVEEETRRRIEAEQQQPQPEQGFQLPAFGAPIVSTPELEASAAAQGGGVPAGLFQRGELPTDRAATPQELAESKSGVEAFAIGAGKGFKTLARAFGLADQPVGVEKQAIQELEKAAPIATTAGEITGEVAPFLLPAGAVSAIPKLAPRVLAALGLGGLEGGIITRGRGGDIEKQLEGGALGGTIAGGAELLFPVIGRIGGALFRRIRGKPPEVELFTPDGQPTAEFASVLDDAGVTFDDLTEGATDVLSSQVGQDVAQAERKAFLEAQGVRPTRAQVTRGATDFQAQQEAAKASGRVRETLEGQEALLVNKFDEAVAGTGGAPVTSGSPVTDQITNKATALDNEISDLYRTATTRAEQSGSLVEPSKLVNSLINLKSKDRITKGVISSIKGDLVNQGIIDDAGKVLRKITVEEAEDIRKGMNQLFTSTNDFGKVTIRQLKNKIDDDVLGQAGEDIFKQARAAKAGFEKDLSRAKISKFDSNQTSLVRDVLENKIDPDDFANKVVFGKKYRPSDIQALKEYTLSGTPAQKTAGKKAWDDLRAETLEKIKELSFTGPKDAAGNQAISRTSFERALNKVGKEKLNILFTPAERKFLQDMKRITQLREPVRGTALGRGPSAQAVIALERKLKELPVLGSLIDDIVDIEGRAVLRAKPKKVGELSQIRKDIRTGVSQAAIAAGAPQTGEI